MDGVDILVRSLSVPQPRGSDERLWQYHSRSDLHSKVACWAIMFDLLQHSSALRRQVADGTVVFGVNFEINDWENARRKNLDLVIARPQEGEQARARDPHSLRSLREHWSIQLSDEQEQRLGELPDVVEGAFGANAVVMALEAKAVMTAHAKAGPRFYDELNSSHSIVHAASQQALAVGFTMINIANTFISPDLNRGVSYTDADEVSEHRQPHDAQQSVGRVEALPRRSGGQGIGYDGLAIVIVDMPNDGSSVTAIDDPPAPATSSPYHYESMISRVAHEYDTRFGTL